MSIQSNPHLNKENSLVETQNQEIKAIIDSINALTLYTWGITIETYLQRVINSLPSKEEGRGKRIDVKKEIYLTKLRKAYQLKFTLYLHQHRSPESLVVA